MHAPWLQTLVPASSTDTDAAGMVAVSASRIAGVAAAAATNDAFDRVPCTLEPDGACGHGIGHKSFITLTY